MKLGIMQPYFFPYLGYFSLIEYVDEFVFFDTPQYKKRSWMNRNRILNTNGEVGYITVPVLKAAQKTSIKDIKIDISKKWQEKIICQMGFYRKHAPYYNAVIEFLQDFFSVPYMSLSELNIMSVIKTWQYIGLSQKFLTFSEMNLPIKGISEPDEWALKITEQLQFDTYVNPPGGKNFFDKGKYISAGIELQFLEQKLNPYIQHIGHFESGLSILDALMFNSRKDIQYMLKQYEIS